jgi:hypothetical protein
MMIHIVFAYKAMLVIHISLRDEHELMSIRQNVHKHLQTTTCTVALSTIIQTNTTTPSQDIIGLTNGMGSSYHPLQNGTLHGS